MPITEKTFEAFIKCATKSYLYFHDVVGVPSEFSQSQDHLREDYKQRCREQLCSAVRDGQWHDGKPDPQSLADRRYRLILGYVVTLLDIHARLDALEQIRITSNGRNCPYIPIRFVPSEKLSTCDKLLLAFDAFAFSQVCGKTPQVGRIIHGCRYTTLTVPLAALLHRVRLVLRSIADQQAKSTTPLLALNKHCAQCEFQVRCRQIAIQKDDLSLLPTLSERERKKQNARGIFSVIQLVERVAKPRLRGEAYLVRYTDDFVLCFQYRADALRVQKALCQRLRKFGLTLESTKTKLVEFGRFAKRHASKRGRNRPQTIYFLGFTRYCTRNRKGNFRVGLRTEKSRLRRSLMRLQDQMRRMRHLQADILNPMLRGHYAYYGIAGNIRALQRVHRAVERYWRIMLSSRSWKGQVLWKQFQRLKERFPLVRPKLSLPYSELQAIAVL